MSEDSPEAISGLISPPVDRIADFCRTVTERHSERWPVSESVLADEFLTFFGLNVFLTFEGMAQFCRSRLQIPVSLAAMPKELRGYNGSYGQNREILIATNQDLPDANLHTLLHELREIIEHEFQRLGSPVARGGHSELEDRAEEFASSVQISATINLIPQILDNASEIEKKWMRVVAYVLIFAVAIFHCSACASLPHIEDAFATERQ